MVRNNTNAAAATTTHRQGYDVQCPRHKVVVSAARKSTNLLLNILQRQLAKEVLERPGGVRPCVGDHVRVHNDIVQHTLRPGVVRMQPRWAETQWDAHTLQRRMNQHEEKQKLCTCGMKGGGGG